MYPLDVHIDSRNIHMEPDWRNKIEEEFRRLQAHYPYPIIHARAQLLGTRHHRRGKQEIHLAVQISGEMVVIKRKGDLDMPLIVEAFDALDRKLQERACWRRGDIKEHARQMQRGNVLRVFPQDGYGFIQPQTADTLAVYFHQHAVQDGDFFQLKPGRRVSFAIESGDKGPQAVWVRPL